MIDKMGWSFAAQKAVTAFEASAAATKASLFVLDEDASTVVDLPTSTLPSVLGDVSHLYALAMLFREFDRGAMEPSTRIVDLLPGELVDGLCVINDDDHSEEITLEHLMSHQSGIADFYDPGIRGTRSISRQVAGRDRSWSLEQALEVARHYPGEFPPGARGKSHYSLTNYLLIGAILARSTGMSLEQLIQLRVVIPLGLKGTFVFTPGHYDSYFSITPVHHQGSTLRAPLALASFDAAGAIVATARELAQFARAMWAGEIFDASWLDYVSQNPRAVRGGLRLARGVLLAGTKNGKPSFVGHAGSTGSGVLVDPENLRVAAVSFNHTKPPHEVLGFLRGILAD